MTTRSTTRAVSRATTRSSRPGGSSGNIGLSGIVTASDYSVVEGATVTLTFEDTSIDGVVSASDYTVFEGASVTLEFTPVANDKQWIDYLGDDIVGATGLTRAWTADFNPPPRIRVTNPTTGLSKIFSVDAPITVSEAPPTAFTFNAGPQPPATGTNDTNASLAWFNLERLPVASTLKQVSCYFSASNSAVQILLATPASGGGWDVSVIATKTAALGLNTWTVLSGALPATAIPANSIIGIAMASFEGVMRYTSDATEYGYSKSPGYGYITFTTAGNYQITQTYFEEMELAWQATSNRAAVTYAVNESFGTTQPANTILGGTAWTYSAGSATPGATGIANKLAWYHNCNAHSQTLSVEFQFDNASGRLVIGKEITSAYYSASEDYGSLCGINIATNDIELYNPYNTEGTLPTVRYTETITAMTLVTSRTYKLEMIKLNKKISIRITDTTNADTQLFEWAVSDLYGYGNGRPVVFSLGGTLHLTRVRWTMGNTNPTTLIFGDSITEGSGATTHMSGYAGQLATEGNCMFSGDGGVTAIACLRQMQMQCQIMTPQYVVLVAGANNAQSDTERDRFIADMRVFWAKARAYGHTPIIATCTPNSDGAYQTRLAAMNAAIAADVISDAIETIDMEAALGGTYTAGLMTDAVHPNQAGHDAMYDQAHTDQPDAF